MGEKLRCTAEIARVVEMLKLKGSCYLPAFQSLRASLDSKAVTARDNVQFMSVLEEPCTKLEKAAPHVRFCSLLLLST
jgi:hypothetical protein